MIMTSGARARLLATGQTTVYVAGDNGTYQKGLAKPTASYVILTAGQYSGNVNITLNGKTDVKSNACVYDLNTGLMWSRTGSNSVGPLSGGMLPFTTNGNGEGAFTYVAAANTAGVGGYNDWRLPNCFELYSLMNIEAPTGLPNATAFPLWSISGHVSSTTIPTNTAYCVAVFVASGYSSQTAKTSAGRITLVRLG